MPCPYGLCRPECHAVSKPRNNKKNVCGSGTLATPTVLCPDPVNRSGAFVVLRSK